MRGKSHHDPKTVAYPNPAAASSCEDDVSWRGSGWRREGQGPSASRTFESPCCAGTPRDTRSRDFRPCSGTACSAHTCPWWLSGHTRPRLGFEGPFSVREREGGEREGTERGGERRERERKGERETERDTEREANWHSKRQGKIQNGSTTLLGREGGGGKKWWRFVSSSTALMKEWQGRGEFQIAQVHWRNERGCGWQKKRREREMEG